ncbi:MAG: class I SAM-dependent methyltransferase [Bdellovibrionales bacterium]|nr:class I SAM-dependent methyltransferase [Bdellovibrionales bacterium]
MIEKDPQELNDFVRPILAPYLASRYTLSQEGQRKVISANAELDGDYAKAHFLPVADWSFRELSGRLEELPPKEYGTILDVCAGTGFVSLNLMRGGLFKKCVAFDLNEDALKILENRARELGVNGVEVQSGDIMSTNFPTNSFDCVMGNSFLHHIPDTKTFLAEMCRILKPGGVICITGEPSPSNMYWQNLIQRSLLALVGKKHGPKGEVPLTDIWQFSTSGLTELLKAVGFSEVKISGYGRWSESCLSFVERLWIRFTGHSAPSWIWRCAYAFRHWESQGVADADSMAILAIRARKP